MTLDRRVAALMRMVQLSGRSFNPDVSVRAFRASYAQANRLTGLRPRGEVEMRELTIPSGGATLPARLYRAKAAGDGPLPVLLYFHGGGWVIGDIASYDGLMRFLAEEGQIAVLSVGYRLAPEHRFPTSHEDAFAAFAWLQKNASSLNLLPDKIAVGGDSAGGGQTAAIAMYATERGLKPPAFAWLIYPSVDATGRFPSRKQYGGNLPLTPSGIEWFTARILNGPADRTAPLLVPLDAPNPERHPPAYISAAQYDPLLDEGRAYYEKLRAAGVPVTYDLRATLPHGFLSMARIVPEAKLAMLDGIHATAAALGVQRVLALTGAAAGIGRALAVEFAKRGYALALADRDAAGLEATADLVRDTVPVATYVLDVADKAAVDAFAAYVLDTYGRVDVLINNAGVALGGDVSDVTVDEIAWVMNINFWGTVYGIKAFLPALERSGDATIVNVSSVYGLYGPPGQAAYAASKFAVRGFSESLRGELRGKGVNVMTVHPGGIKTDIATNARIAAAADQVLGRERARAFAERFLTESPESAAKAIARGVSLHSERVLIGSDAIRVDVLTRALGPYAGRAIAALARLPAKT
jgi:acetyl esterase/lipase/NADP-dependent 3-hydroxy acid dehydrogenase YdfG